jgi:O-antigen ligase
MRSYGRIQALPIASATVFLAATLTALAVTHTGIPLVAVHIPLTLIVALAALAAVVVAISLGPRVVFPFWLVLAPFVQTAAPGSAVGHKISMAFYSAPPFLFLMWGMLQRKRVRPSVIDLFPGLYLAFVLASAIFSGATISVTQKNLTGVPAAVAQTVTSVALTQIYAAVAIGVIAYYFCAFADFGDSLERRVAAVLLVSGSIIGAFVVLGRVVGLAGNVAGFNFGSTYIVPNTGAVVEGRASALGGPGALGTFLGAAFVVALSVLVWQGPHALRKLSLVAVVITPAALAFTLTRAPLIAAFCVGFLVVALRSRSRWPTILAVATALILVVGAWGSIASTPVYKNRISDKGNVQGRALLAKWSLRLAAQKPLTGWGYGSFDRIKNSSNLSASGSTPRSFALAYTSHNTFLTILVELGIVGICLMLVPLLVASKRAIRRALHPIPNRWAIVAFSGILGVWVINAGTFDMRFFSFLSALPWLAAGFLRRNHYASPSD